MNIRHFINLVESAGRESVGSAAESMKEAASILMGHVHEGTADDSSLHKLMTLLPRPSTPMQLYRVIALAPKQAKILRSKGRLALDAKPFASWTSNSTNLPRIAADVQSRVAQRMGSEVFVVEATLPAAQIVVDVQAFLNEIIKANLPGIDTYYLRRYGRGEDEVIVHHPTRFVLTAQNTQAWAPETQRRPKVGEDVFFRWDADGENGTTIQRVLPDDEQDETDKGLWRVEVPNNEIMVFWTGHEWEEVE